jgi:integrase
MYVKSDIVKFKDFLVDCPKYLTQDELKQPFDTIMAKYKGTHYEKLSAKTIKSKYIGLLHAIFSYAVINDYRTDNPVSNVRVLTSHNDEPKRLPFSIPQLKQITHSYLFTDAYDDKHIEYKFIILLAIFTGARLEEICRLKNADIGNEDGISFIHIHSDLADGHTLKTASSRRRVPLHPRLMEHFQFQKYLESVSNRKYVFPMINSGYTVVNRKSHSVSKWYGQFFTAIGLSDKRLTFHSFRHTFKALGRASGIERSILDCLQGHKDKSVSMSYGRDEYGSVYSLKTLYDAILKIDVFNVL